MAGKIPALYTEWPYDEAYRGVDTWYVVSVSSCSACPSRSINIQSSALGHGEHARRRHLVVQVR
jgi:hypothetical protein